MTGMPRRQAPTGWWEMVLAWCPPEDSPLFGGPASSASRVIGVTRVGRRGPTKVPGDPNLPPPR